MVEQLKSTLKKLEETYTKYNTETIFLAATVLILTLITILKFPDLLNTRLMQDRWFICMQYIQQGTLYQNDAYCAQGPVLFYSLYAIYTLFKEHMYLALTFVGIILNTIILWSMRQIIIKEAKKKAFLGLISLYGIVIYFPILSSVYDILLSTFLFMLAVYIVLHTKIKWKIYISSILFTLGFFTKVVVAIPMACVFAYYLYREHKTEYKAILKEGLKFSLTFFVLTGAIYLIFPKIFYYILIAHSTIASGTYAGALEMILKGLNIVGHHEWYASIVVYIIIFSTIFFFIKKNIYFFISSGYYLYTFTYEKILCLVAEAFSNFIV